MGGDCDLLVYLGDFYGRPKEAVRECVIIHSGWGFQLILGELGNLEQKEVLQ